MINIYAILIICNLLFLSQLFVPPSQYANSIDSPFVSSSIDYTTLFTDIATFVVTGFLAFIAIRISQWVSNNSKWKEDRERFELHQANTNDNLTNAIKLLVDDLKATKEKCSNEIKEIESDFQALNNKVIIHEERIAIIKDRLE